MANTLRNSLKMRNATIRRYFPDVLANAAEFQGLADVVEPELDKIIGLLMKHALDTFVFDLDEDGCMRWEKMLKLTPRGTDTIDDRRTAILATIVPNTPYTLRQVKNILNGLCGEGNYTVDLNHNKYHIKISVSLGAKRQRDIVVYSMKCILPANLTIEVVLLYNRHIDLKRFTHGRMKSIPLTHRQLKEEVLPNA